MASGTEVKRQGGWSKRCWVISPQLGINASKEKRALISGDMPKRYYDTVASGPEVKRLLSKANLLDVAAAA
jgi:hypothetical protein